MHFMVKGRGPFPFDMLRHDCCWPATSYSAGIINQAPLRQIGLLSDLDNVSINRWNSYEWDVYFEGHEGWYNANGEEE